MELITKDVNKKYNHTINNNHIGNIEVFFLDSDLEEFMNEHDIEIIEDLETFIPTSLDIDFNVVYRDTQICVENKLIKSVIVRVKNNQYKCDVYSCWNGCIFDEGFALNNMTMLKKEQDMNINDYKEKEVSMDIYFNDFNKETQDEILKLAGILEPKEANWDTMPITSINFISEQNTKH